MEEVIDHNGIRITITNKQNGTWEASFFNAPGNFDFLHHVKALRGLESKEVAIEAGKKFVNEHQWQYVEDFKLFSIYVRLWWNDDWGYSIRYGASENKGNFPSREKAISAAKKRIAEKLEEF